MKRPAVLLALAGACCALVDSALAQGSLTPPPGPPAPAMKTLDQIYAAVEATGSGGGGTGERPLHYDITPRTTPLGPVPGLAIGEGAALFLKANGADIQGESPHESLDRKNSIHVIAYGSSVSVATSGGTSTGRRTYEPLTFTKRVDKSSPLLLKALAQNEVVAGELRFYRPNPSGDGTTEHYFTVKFGNGRIIRLEQGLPGYDTFSVTFTTIEWTYVPGGVSFTDTISTL